MFALPFLGTIFHETQRKEYDHDKEMAEFVHSIDNLNYVPVGGCKIYYEETADRGMINGRACKQKDGSWKKE